MTLLAASLPRIAGAQMPPYPLEIGVLPNINSRLLLAQYQPLRAYLLAQIHRQVQISTAPSWKTFHQRTLDLDYDIVVTASHLARVAQIDQGFIPLASCQPNIKGIIIYARARPMASISELEGQTLVLSNPYSLVTLRGMQWLAEKGLHRERNFTTINTPTDDSVGNVVVQGNAIAALLSSGEYRAIPAAIKTQIEILTTLSEVPGFIIMASPKLATEDVRAIKAHLLRFSTGSEEGKTFMSNTGFTGMTELPSGLMESMDQYAAATRKMLAIPG
jgi:phosphonate transport system substrate-binding protein